MIQVKTAGKGVVLLAGVLLSLAFASMASSPALNAVDGDSSVPVIVVWRYPGNAVSRAGLELAVWKDGCILVSAVRESPGERILLGKTDPKDVKEALESIQSASFFDNWASSVAVDMSSTDIHVGSGDKQATHACTESLMPGVGGDVSADRQYRAFVRMWRRTRGAIESISPTELRLLGEQEEFRGYRAAHPLDTKWRP